MSKHLTTLVTGASSGVGRATALELAGRGHRVLAAARRKEKLDELAQAEQHITALQLDVTDAAAVSAAALRVDELTAGHGVDVLVNAAGYALLGPVAGLSSEAIEHQFATNVLGPLNVTRALLPKMREGHSGRIINISSVLGRFALPGLGAYSASKYALEALSDALRIELAPHGISVVLIEPTWVATNIAEGSLQQTLPSAAAINGDADADQFSKAGAYVADQLAHNSITAETVARQIATAAEATRPKTRYVLPAKGKLLVSLMGAMPDRIADHAKRRTVGFAPTASNSAA
jgi:NAD(P)-dependent dehydrogenase (short-subunit alcohol dehydrogenase family)